MLLVIDRADCNSRGLWTISGHCSVDQDEVPWAARLRDDVGAKIISLQLAHNRFSYQGEFIGQDASISIEVDFLKRGERAWMPRRWQSLGLVLTRGDDGKVNIHIADNTGIIRLGDGLPNGINISGNRGEINGMYGEGVNSVNDQQEISGSDSMLSSPQALCFERGGHQTDLQVIAWPTSLGLDGLFKFEPIGIGRNGDGQSPQSFFRAIYGPVGRLPNGRRDPMEPNNRRSGCVSSLHATLSLTTECTNLVLTNRSRSGDVVVVEQGGGNAEQVVSGNNSYVLPIDCHLALGNSSGRVSVHCRIFMGSTLPEHSPTINALYLEVVDSEKRDRCGVLSRTLFIVHAGRLQQSGERLYPAPFQGFQDSGLIVMADKARNLLLFQKDATSFRVGDRGLDLSVPILPAEGQTLEWVNEGLPIMRRIGLARLTPTKPS